MINKIKLLDGSMSFPMTQQGYDLKNNLWTGSALINDPEVIKNIHKGYVSSGADYISTSTYQISFDRLKKIEEKEGFVESVKNIETGKKETFFNLGPNNDWKKNLDKNITKEINEKFAIEMGELGYL